MKVIGPSFVIEDDFDGDELLKKIERAGRTCYKSEDKVTADSARKFVKKIMGMGHESVIEHEKLTVRLVCDRGVTHEIVRHRLASYSQESTRYCNYTKDKFGSEITVIDPFFWKSAGPPSSDNAEKYALWKESMEASEKAYFKLIDLHASPQEARSVLPNSLKTEIVMTMNLREWRHFFKLRTAPGSHPQMREVAVPMLEEFRRRIPVLFDDITVPGAPGGDSIGT
jgi:thymidylate synthase (FAD)